MRKKVLVVDDSAFMRKMITDFLSSHPELDVVATARNGKDAISKIEKFQPDVMTMDVEMPEMNGIEALSYIMSHHPLPIVMLSSLTKEGADTTLAAMEQGAVDFVAKPSGTISLDLEKVKDDLIKKVIAASRVNMLQMKPMTNERPASFLENRMPEQPEKEPLKNEYQTKYSTRKKIVVVGTSTGGPRALQQVLTRLSPDIQAPVLIVQHMPPGFTKSLAQRLDSLCSLHVKEVEDGEMLQKGTAYIAPGDYHFTVRKVGGNITAHLNQTPAVNGHRPSVDVMFESVSQLSDYDKIAVIMTGMGSDGANGLAKLKKDGNVRAIAESKDSCVVFGMPKAAIATHLVDEIKPVDEIAQAIAKNFPQKG